VYAAQRTAVDKAVQDHAADQSAPYLRDGASLHTLQTSASEEPRRTLI
jgi:hypothetical protein